jgi:type I restriction enzyme R subunit
MRDKFAADYSYLSQHWEAVSPDSMQKYLRRTISGSHKSTNQSDPQAVEENFYGTHGRKNIKIIHDDVTVQAIKDDLDTIVMDEYIL